MVMLRAVRPITASAPPVSVAYAASVVLDARAGSLFRIAATGPLTISDVTNGFNGQQIRVEVLASGADRPLTIADVTATVPAGLWWVGELTFNADANTWLLVTS